MEHLRETLELQDLTCYVLEPEYLDEAAVDIVQGPDGLPCVRYSAVRICELLMSEEGMSEEEALEWFYTNIECAYFGPGTPVYLGGSAEEDDE